MARKTFLGMAALLVFGMMTAAPAEEPYDAKQTSLLSGSTQFASLHTELESLRAEVRQISFAGGGDKGDACDACGGGGCNCYCDLGCGGWFAGAEAVLLQANSEEGAFIDTDTNVQIDPTYDYEVSPRIWLGYRNCEGLGIRARYWNFDHDANTLGPRGGINQFALHSLDVHAVDLEATQLICWGPMQMNFAGGARYGKVESSGTIIFLPGGQTFTRARDYEGFGPTIAAEARLPIGCSRLALIGSFRGSALFGDAESTSIANANVTTGEFKDSLAYVLESQVGVEYSRCLCTGILSVRAVMEGQVWANTVGSSTFDFNPTSLGPQNDIGFFGAAFGVEYAR